MAKGGPKTAAGKAAVRHNAVQHGILSSTPVVPFLEREEDWHAFRYEMLTSLAPNGALESALAERIVTTLWRLRRVERFEAQVISVDQDRVLERVSEDLLVRAGASARQARLIPDILQTNVENLEAARCTREYFTRFQQRDSDEIVPDSEASDIIRVIADMRKVDADQAIAAALPPDVEESSPWTPAQVYDVLKAIEELSPTTMKGPDVAIRVAKSFTEALQHVEAEIARLQMVVDEVGKEVNRERQLALLPNDQRLHTITRYEAHLNRQLYQALHELEALQARRRGEAAPLARLEVHGTPPL